MSYFEILSRNSPGRTEEDYESPQSLYWMFWMGCEPGIAPPNTSEERNCLSRLDLFDSCID